MSNSNPTRRRILQVSGAGLAGTTGIVGTAAAGDDCDLECEADIVFNDQSVHASVNCENDCAVFVSEAVLPCGGYIDIHDPDLETDTYNAGKGIGATCYLPAGTYAGVEICLFEENCSFGDCISWDRDCIQESQTLTAMLHLDTDHDEEFEHYCDHNDPDVTTPEDGAYFCDGPVADQATISP